MASQSLNRLKQLGLSQLFERYPDFSIIPSNVGELALAGTIDFKTSHPACGEFTEAFDAAQDLAGEVASLRRLAAVLVVEADQPAAIGAANSPATRRLSAATASARANSGCTLHIVAIVSGAASRASTNGR